MKLDKKHYHSIQLKKIQLISLKSTYNESNEGLEGNVPLSISLKNAGEVTDRNKGVCYLQVNIGSENKESELFNVEIVYKGFCESSVDISEKDLKFYLEVQSIPMLWAYARESINNIIVKMGLPPIILPAVNINEIIGEIIREDKMKED
ncbi:putative protein-export chaperone SecB [Clostridiales bacterium oral taxon 876 str. F0540]|nr:putative protein-export chaperone SecB [Clostridiales bacterium oral taxon 876 str. F0540]